MDSILCRRFGCSRRGLVARTENDPRSIYLGSLRFMAEAGLALGQRLGGVAAEANAAGRPIACMGWEDSVRGLFVFRERLRPKQSKRSALSVSDAWMSLY